AGGSSSMLLRACPASRQARRGHSPPKRRTTADGCGQRRITTYNSSLPLTPTYNYSSPQTPTNNQPQTDSHSHTNPVYLTPKPDTEKHDCNRGLRDAAVAWMRMRGADPVA